MTTPPPSSLHGALRLVLEEFREPRAQRVLPGVFHPFPRGPGHARRRAPPSPRRDRRRASRPPRPFCQGLRAALRGRRWRCQGRGAHGAPEGRLGGCVAVWVGRPPPADCGRGGGAACDGRVGRGRPAPWRKDDLCGGRGTPPMRLRAGKAGAAEGLFVGGSGRSGRAVGVGVGSIRSQVLGSTAAADDHTQRRLRFCLRAGHAIALLVGNRGRWPRLGAQGARRADRASANPGSAAQHRPGAGPCGAVRRSAAGHRSDLPHPGRTVSDRSSRNLRTRAARARRRSWPDWYELGITCVIVRMNAWPARFAGSTARRCYKFGGRGCGPVQGRPEAEPSRRGYTDQRRGGCWWWATTFVGAAASSSRVSWTCARSRG